MKTPNEIKDEVAKSHGWDNWILMATYKTHKELASITNEAMDIYADQFKEVGQGDFEKGYNQGYEDATKEACQEIAKNYKPNNR